MRVLVTASLEALGYSVEAVDSGHAALAASQREDFDAVILDVDMPGIDGLAVGRALRSNPKTSTSMIAMHTSLEEVVRSHRLRRIRHLPAQAVRCALSGRMRRSDDQGHAPARPGRLRGAAKPRPRNDLRSPRRAGASIASLRPERRDPRRQRQRREPARRTPSPIAADGSGCRSRPAPRPRTAAAPSGRSRRPESPSATNERSPAQRRVSGRPGSVVIALDAVDGERRCRSPPAARPAARPDRRWPASRAAAGVGLDVPATRRCRRRAASAALGDAGGGANDERRAALAARRPIGAAPASAATTSHHAPAALTTTRSAGVVAAVGD